MGKLVETQGHRGTYVFRHGAESLTFLPENGQVWEENPRLSSPFSLKVHRNREKKMLIRYFCLRILKLFCEEKKKTTLRGKHTNTTTLPL